MGGKDEKGDNKCHNKIKGGKASRLDSVVVEMLKYGDDGMIEWLLRILIGVCK